MTEDKDLEGNEDHGIMMESRFSSTDNSDREGDTFEDAPDSASRPPSQRPSPSLSMRSLTQARPTSSSTSTSQVQTSDSSAYLQDPLDDDARRPSLAHQGSSASRSPRSRARRISTASLDDVYLEGALVDNPAERSRHSTSKSRDASHATSPPPKQPPRQSTTLAQRAQGLSGSLPSVPWGPTPAPSSGNSVPSPSPPIRKLSSPFSWLSRNTNPVPKDISSTKPYGGPPQLSQEGRRGTSSSLGMVSPNTELLLSTMGEEEYADSNGLDSVRKQGRNSLRDRFKLVRMREEAGISSLGEEADGTPVTDSATTGVGLGVGSPEYLNDEKESGLAGQAPAEPPSKAEPPTSPLSSAINPHLPPGTVSGLSVGPSATNDSAGPVDWDLWQSVVYEGPSAVARTSPEELNDAIAGGIPSAIRGVVWQVLAQSRNDELEALYHELVDRGTDKARDRHSSSSNATDVTPTVAKSELTNGKVNGIGKERESAISSASSDHSEQSTPATPATNGMGSPTVSHKDDREILDKLPATLLAEKQKKAKDETAAIKKLEKIIRRDLGTRTSYSKYAASAGLQDGLFGVCKAYALYDEGVGYAQGMNFLAMPLLFNMPEEEAFCLLVRLMSHYHLRELFVQDMPGLHHRLYQFERLLEDLEPALYCHLHRRGVSPQLYATQWFLTLFAYRFPLQLVLRVYDLVLSEGLEGAILKFGMVLMQRNAETLLGMDDMSALTTFLKDRLFDVYIDQTPSATSILESGFFGNSGGSDKEVYRADILVQDACAVKITPELLKSYTAEWEEIVRSGKERETELESLKTANSNLSTKVRSLEERAEKFDTEHVQVASELVRTKVENEELLDRNESLNGQVEELKHLVERQPEEVEGRLKEEMDRLMKRNLEVHNENQALEEQMAEMEKDLVNVKMQYAEINAAHETLKQKWSDLRKALGD
ncbi:MAG: GTPase-activating protein [Sclerophora amabilis]|nr:MAG: GTPase-activating protein [Sclerophora amabilis]